MTHAYNRMYLDQAMRSFALMLDYAVHDLNMSASEFITFFIVSGISDQFGSGNPKYIAGMSGIELAYEVVYRIFRRYPTHEYTSDNNRSNVYWAGWSLAYYQWFCGDSFSVIMQDISIDDITEMYDKYHEMDLQHFIDEINRRRRLLAYAGMIGLKKERLRQGYSQRELAELSHVPLRSIQQYEQRQKDIRRAAAETVLNLAHALSCRPEDIMISGSKGPNHVLATKTAVM